MTYKLPEKSSNEWCFTEGTWPILQLWQELLEVLFHSLLKYHQGRSWYCVLCHSWLGFLLNYAEKLLDKEIDDMCQVWQVVSFVVPFNTSFMKFHGELPSEHVIVQRIVSGDALKLVHDTIFLKNVVHNVCYIEAGIRFVKRLKRQ